MEFPTEDRSDSPILETGSDVQGSRFSSDSEDEDEVMSEGEGKGKEEVEQDERWVDIAVKTSTTL